MVKKVCVIGLGYVGLPLAVSFSEFFEVVGFDINQKRVDELKKGFDITQEVSQEDIESSGIKFTCLESEISLVDVFIITVPTPVDKNNNPDLTMLIDASEIAGRKLTQSNLVIYESTVYPGCTEEICIPILEKESSLKLNSNFGVGYSPERINPGDKSHSFKSINKVVSASNEEYLELINQFYSKVVNADIYNAKSIKVAEASKVIENTQRDINIALMNEFSTILSKMNIRSKDVIDAASTKWNFINFEPGLVGGHCIGVDPYYLAHKAKNLGVDPKVILAGRETNNYMPEFIVKNVLAKNKCSNPEVLVLGLTFKENCPDIRNSKAFDVIRELNLKGISPKISDIYINNTDNLNSDIDYSLITELEDYIDEFDILFLLVPHKEYIEMGYLFLRSLLKSNGYFYDLKSKFHNQSTDGSL